MFQFERPYYCKSYPRQDRPNEANSKLPRQCMETVEPQNGDRMRKLLSILVMLAWPCAVILPANAAVTIDTTGGVGVNGGTFGAFGEPDTSTFGQTFTVVGPNTELGDVSFFMDDYHDIINPDFIDFAIYVAAWDGLKATGPVIFQSAPLTTTNNGGAGGNEKFTVNVGVQLTAGQKYVAFANTSGFFDGIPGISNWPTVSPSTYAGGEFVYSNTGSNFSKVFSDTWELNSNNTSLFAADTFFIAHFSDPSAAAPEPASLVVWSLIGLSTVVIFRRRQLLSATFWRIGANVAE
jgi:hypothetical protein